MVIGPKSHPPENGPKLFLLSRLFSFSLQGFQSLTEAIIKKNRLRSREAGGQGTSLLRDNREVQGAATTTRRLPRLRAERRQVHPVVGEFSRRAKIFHFFEELFFFEVNAEMP